MKKSLFITLVILLLSDACGRLALCGDVQFAPINIDSRVTNKRAVYIPSGPALTLSDCYELALRQSELIAIDAEQIRVAEARFLEAMSIMMPYVSFQSLDQQEEAPNITGTLASLKPARSSTRNFHIQQTLFSGFKAIAAAKGSTFEKRQRMEEKLRAEQLLLVDVSNAFYLFRETSKDLMALQKIKTALRNRVGDLRGRENLGRSRPSEVVNAKAQMYIVEADMQVVKSQSVLAKQLLEFLVGRPVDKIADTYEMPKYLFPEEHYVAKFLQRPDIRAAEYAWQVAKKESEAVNSDFLPTISWSGDWFIQRTGFDEGTDWDIMLNVDVPIFDGTETLGRSKEYILKAHERELEYRRLKRKAPYDIKDAYVRLKTALDVYENLRKAYATAKLNYYLQRKDYNRSLVNNLEVLASIQTLQNAERDYIHAIYEAKRLYWQLRVAVGENIKEALSDAV